MARLQAASAFTGVGFTASESERIVNHSARRRILIVLMILGSAGIVTAVSTLILSFTGVSERSQWISRGALLLFGLALLWTIAASKRIERWMVQRLQSILRRFTDLEAIDFVVVIDEQIIVHQRRVKQSAAVTVADFSNVAGRDKNWQKRGCKFRRYWLCTYNGVHVRM